MEAILFDGNTLDLKHKKNMEIPKPSNHEVVIKVAYSGVCGTDVHIILGNFACTKGFPVVLGHEFCGTIAEAGPKASFKKGQRVAVDPNSACNLCEPCHSGKYHHCSSSTGDHTIGIFRNGGWAQYCVVPETQVYALPDGITLEQAALTEPMSCLAHGWDMVAPIFLGQKVLILGAGIISNLWAVLLHLQGHRDVTVSAPDRNRFAIAKKMGLGFVYCVPEELQASKQKFDLIIDCTGVAKVLEKNFPFLANGAKYVVFGCSGPEDKAMINPFDIYKKELSIIGVKINVFSFPKAIKMLTSLSEGYLNYSRLGIEMFNLSQYQEAIDALKCGKIAKAIFKIE